VVNLGAGTEGGEEIFSLQVTEGRAALISAGAEREMPAGTSLFLTPRGAGAETPAFVLSPPPAARILTLADAAAPVEFILHNQTGSGKPHIELARDRGFTQPFTAAEADPPGTADNSSGIILAVPPGTWWWRASSPELTGDTGETWAAGQFTVVRSSPPEPVSPLPEAAFYYRTDPPELRFQWKAPDDDEALFYVLEAADNPDMANPVLQAEVRYNSLVYSQLTEGQWYWRVTPVFPAFYQGKIPASPVIPFTISRGGPPAPLPAAAASAAAELPEAAGTAAESPAAGPHSETAPAGPSGAVLAVRPRPNAAPVEPPPLPSAARRQPENDYVISPETLGESRTLVFSWDPVEGADRYIFTLLGENDSGVRQSIVTAEGAGTSYTLRDLSLLDRGRFIWQVEAVSRGTDGTMERRGIPGENRFTVDIPQPGTPRGKDVGILYGR
jgi:hypothetical protein